jgi:hypothetical protein
MKAIIEFDYFNYARIDDHMSFWLELEDDDGKLIKSIHIGYIDVPRDIIKPVGHPVHVPNVYDAIIHATTRLGTYWEE